MRSGFILSCESTIDLPYSYCEQRDIPFCSIPIRSTASAMRTTWGVIRRRCRSFTAFWTPESCRAPTQLNEFQYETFFDALLQQGDVLHIAFGSGMTASVQNAMLAAETLREKYPERKLTVIDSLCSSSGYGLLVDGAADLRDEGRIHG